MNIRNAAIAAGLVIAASLTAAILVGPQPGVSATDEPLPRIVSVTGTGEVKARPDNAIINSGVTSDGSTAQEALARNNAAMNAVIAALKAAGVSEDDIQTSGFSVSPQYAAYEPGKSGPPRVVSYQVSNQVTARVSKLDRLGSTLDALVRAGSNQINGVSFGISDQNALLEQARRKALADARARAELYAGAAGARVGMVLQISEMSATIPMPTPRFAAREAAAFDSVPIATGQNTLSATINVVYELR